MSIEKINFSYPKDSLQSVFDTQEMTALELAAKTSKKVDECVELVNGVEQIAIEATAIVDDMHIAQEQFITENNDIRQQLVVDNQAFIDTLEADKTTFEADMTAALEAFEDSINTSKTTFENDMNNTLDAFETSINTSKTTFETNMTNAVNNIVTNSDTIIEVDVNNKITDLIADGTMSEIINDQLLTDINADVQEINQGFTALKDQFVAVENFRSAGDDKATIEAAFAYMKSIGGGELRFGKRAYTINPATIEVTDIPGLVLRGDSTIINTTTTDLDFFFHFTNCPRIQIENITFDSLYVGKSQVKLTSCERPVIRYCKFINFKADVTDPSKRHALELTYSPNPLIENNHFENIGENFGGSGEVTSQYRSITLNTGSGNPKLSKNTFKGVFQSVVFAEFAPWAATTVYAVDDNVLYQNNVYKCSTAHTSTGAFDATKWALVQSNITASETLFFTDNININVRDNAVYAVENTKRLICIGNTFEYCNDEPICVINDSAFIIGNFFRNCRNRYIAIDTQYKDRDTIIIAENHFLSDDPDYNADSVEFRSATAPGIVKNLIIKNNVIENTNQRAAYMYLGKCTRLQLTGNIFKTAAAAYDSVVELYGFVGNGIISENHFEGNDASAYAVKVDDATSVLNFRNNKLVLCRATRTDNMTVTGHVVTFTSNVYINDSSPTIVHANNAPTVGAWKRGDIVYSLVPAAAGKVGWVCVAAGTPGTWKAFGTIDA